MMQSGVVSGKSGASRNSHDVDPSVNLSGREAHDRHGDAVANAVANALHWDFALPRHRVVAHCESGWVTLTGEVDRAYQRSAAEADALRVEGVRGVTNAITVCAAGMNH